MSVEWDCCVIRKAAHTHNVFAVVYVSLQGAGCLRPVRAAQRSCCSDKPHKTVRADTSSMANSAQAAGCCRLEPDCLQQNQPQPTMPCVDLCRWLSNNGLRQLPEEVGCLPALESL